ncbi:MAG: hypothetical protein RIR26_2350, partial [Pseudomonadota bacterium]
EHHYLADAIPGLALIALSLIFLLDFHDSPDANAGMSNHSVHNYYLFLMFMSVSLTSWPRGFDFLDVVKNVRANAAHAIPPELSNWISGLPKNVSIYSDTLGMSHLMSQRRYYYTEFTRDSVYQRNGAPEVLALVFPLRDKPVPGHSFHSWLRKEGLSRLIVEFGSARGTVYEFDRTISGQSDGGVRIFRRIGRANN